MSAQMHVQSWRASIIGIFEVPAQAFVQAVGRQLWSYPDNGLLLRNEIFFGVLDRDTGKLIGSSGSQNEPDIYDEEKARNTSKDGFRCQFPSFSFFCVLFSSLFALVSGFFMFRWGWGWWGGFYDNPKWGFR